MRVCVGVIVGGFVLVEVSTMVAVPVGVPVAVGSGVGVGLLKISVVLHARLVMMTSVKRKALTCFTFLPP